VDKCWIGVGHYCLKTEPKKKVPVSSMYANYTQIKF